MGFSTEISTRVTEFIRYMAVFSTSSTRIPKLGVFANALQAQNMVVNF